MVKFSNANTKLKRLYQIPELGKFLVKRKIYSFDLLSGHSCPFASKCLSKAVVTDEGRRIQDGPHTEFRCYSASQEVLFTAAYNLRKGNFDALRGKSKKEIFSSLEAALPKNAGIVRLHSSGEFFSQDYFDAWLDLAITRPEILFYTYTKSLPYWVNRISMIPDNLILTASWGGRRDDMIEQYNLRSVKVVFHPEEAEGLEIDHTDEHACRPSLKNQDFALLLHGVNPQKSKAAEAIKRMKREKIEFSYS
jgi:hypothetical protein